MTVRVRSRPASGRHCQSSRRAYTYHTFQVGGLPELEETGFCVYDLQRMHDEHAQGAQTCSQTCSLMAYP